MYIYFEVVHDYYCTWLIAHIDWRIHTLVSSHCSYSSRLLLVHVLLPRSCSSRKGFSLKLSVLLDLVKMSCSVAWLTLLTDVDCSYPWSLCSSLFSSANTHTRMLLCLWPFCLGLMNIVQCLRQALKGISRSLCSFSMYHLLCFVSRFVLYVYNTNLHVMSVML